MGKVQENQVELQSSETHQLMVHSDDAYFWQNKYTTKKRTGFIY
jgi:Zn-finger nucleic acid-binding protein